MAAFAPLVLADRSGSAAPAGWTFHLPYRGLGQSRPGLGPAQNAVSQALERAFDDNSAKIAGILKSELGKGDVFARGFTLYDINLHIGKPDIKFITPTTFSCKVNGNRIIFKSTQPTVAGKWADPAFEANWDTTLNGTLVPPAGAARPRVEGVVLSVPTLRVKSRNAASGIVGGAALIVVSAMEQTPKGRQIIQDALDRALRRDVTDRVNTELARL